MIDFNNIAERDRPKNVQKKKNIYNLCKCLCRKVLVHEIAKQLKKIDS